MPLAGIRAVTLDFGNTLVPVDRAALRAVTRRTAAVVCPALGLGDPEHFMAAWSEERDRQFREEVPKFREVELPQRARRVLARLRAVSPPPADVPWDDEATAAHASESDVEFVVEAYSQAFVAEIPAPPGSGRVIGDLATRGFRVAILSNWPLAATIDRFAHAAGWLPWLSGIYVSERIGTIKPHPAIFARTARALGVEPGAILHVGDDWAADVVGARSAGWRVAYLRGRQGDTPLPTSARREDVTPDLELDSLDDLGAQIDDPTA